MIDTQRLRADSRIGRATALHRLHRSALLAAALCVAALSVAVTTPAPAGAQFRIGEGPVAALFNAKCASCHGETLRGGTAGSLLDDEWVHGGDDAALAHSIREGWVEDGMPGFGETLSDDDIRALVIFIRETRHVAATGALPKVDPRPDGVRTSDRHHFLVETVFRHPGELWSVEFLPDGRMLTTDIGGALLIVDADGDSQTVTGAPEVWVNNQGGLLDIGIHPDYADNGWIYLAFSDASDRALLSKAGMTKIVRGRLKDGAWVDQETIFDAPDAFHIPTGHHFGTRLVFQDGYLFFSIGDRGRQDDAQDLSLPNGKIHRIHDDGRVPQDNPFRAVADAFPTIWTYGNRNPQGIALHPQRGVIYATEHGPRGGDELNRIEPGLNYGWPKVTFGMNYNGTPITDRTEGPGFTQPLWHWTPSIAACGLAIASGEAFPAWEGDLFAGGLASQVVERLRLGPHDEIVERETLLQGEGRVRDVVAGPGGVLYVVYNNSDDSEAGSRIVRVSPAPGADLGADRGTDPGTDDDDA